MCLYLILLPQQPKTSSPRPQQQRPKIGQNWASGGPGMQAIFLDSSQKPCGTGVFLPQQAGANFPQGKKTTGTTLLLHPIYHLHHGLQLICAPRTFFSNVSGFTLWVQAALRFSFQAAWFKLSTSTCMNWASKFRLVKVPATLSSLYKNIPMLLSSYNLAPN